MTHVHVGRLCKSCQCIVCLTCLAGKMSSKTILIGLSIFRCGVVWKNPYMEDLPGSSLRTIVVCKTLNIFLDCQDSAPS